MHWTTHILVVTLMGGFAGAIAYADDLILLSSSLCKFQTLLDICCNVGTIYNLSVNPSKSVGGVFGKRSFNSLPQLKLFDSVLNGVKK